MKRRYDMTARVLRLRARRPDLAKVRGAAIALGALIALAPLAAMANVRPRSSGGQLAGEPVGITDIAILHEHLMIDLRPLANAGQVGVAATYHLDNRAGAKHLDLVFASGSDTLSAFRVTLDGQPIASALRPGATLPASWQDPPSTPLPDGTGELDYELRDHAAPVGFQLDVAPGRHELSISYAADAMLHHHGEPTVMRQFAYVLSPARAWAGFGGIDVTVHAPPGWHAGVSPALARKGDTLHGKLPGVPADAIAVTVQAPSGAFVLWRYASNALFAIVAIGGGFTVYRRTRVRERQRATAGNPRSVLATLGRAIAWASAFFGAGLLAIFGPGRMLPAGQADHDGYGQAIAAIAVGIGAVLALLIGVWLASLAGRRAHAASAKPA
jgi:hypothetical protein